MKKTILLFLLLSIITFSYSQNAWLDVKTRAQLIANLDSAMLAKYYIDLSEAEKILEKPVFLKDTTYKLSGGILRFSFHYIAKYVDSTSIGRLNFEFQQYKDTLAAKSTYEFLKNVNQNDTSLTSFKELGNNGYLVIDSANQPFIIISKENKIFKFRVFYLTTENSLNELLVISKKVVDKH